MKLLFVKFPFGTEMRMSQQNHEGGWSGIGMATVGIHPNDFDLYPNKIPPGRVVQNCHFNNKNIAHIFVISKFLLFHIEKFLVVSTTKTLHTSL